MGTMPHALVGYTGGRCAEGAEAFRADHRRGDGRWWRSSITPAMKYRIRCAARAGSMRKSRLQPKGKTFGIRLDTHGGRFAEGLDYERSVETVGDWLGVSGEYNIVEQVLGQRAFQLDPNNILVDKVRRILFGKGVSVASIIHVRRALDEAGFARRADRRLVGLRSPEMPGHGGGQRAARHGRNGEFLAGDAHRDLCNGRYHRLWRGAAGENRPRISVRLKPDFPVADEAI